MSTGGFWDSVIDGVGDFFSSDTSSRPGTGNSADQQSFGMDDPGLVTDDDLWDETYNTLFDWGSDALDTLDDFADTKTGQGIIGGAMSATGSYLEKKANSDNNWENQRASQSMQLSAAAQQNALNRDFQMQMQQQELDHPTNAPGKADKTTSNLHANPVR